MYIIYIYIYICFLRKEVVKSNHAACHLMVSCLGHYKYYIYLDDHNEFPCNDYIQQYVSTIDGF